MSPLEPLSSYQGSARPSGDLTITFNGISIAINGQVSGLEPGTAISMALHEGASCADIGEQLASQITGETPWAGLPPLQADSAGAATVSATAGGFVMSSVTGRTLVLMDAEGNAMSCGETPRTAGKRLAAVSAIAPQKLY